VAPPGPPLEPPLFKMPQDFQKITFAVMSYNTKLENFLDLQTYKQN